MPTHLVWFRRDLRLQDNLALAAACRDASARVLALYISTPAQWQAHDMAPRQAAFISAQLNALQTALAEKGIPLLFHEVADFNASIETAKRGYPAVRSGPEDPGERRAFYTLNASLA